MAKIAGSGGMLRCQEAGGWSEDCEAELFPKAGMSVNRWRSAWGGSDRFEFPAATSSTNVTMTSTVASPSSVNCCWRPSEMRSPSASTNDGAVLATGASDGGSVEGAAAAGSGGTIRAAISNAMIVCLKLFPLNWSLNHCGNRALRGQG